MYKLLLSLRYLRTRWIALVSIVSVSLGVMTLIVTNAVMSGFSGQLKDRIHNTLADVIVQSISTDGVEDPVRIMGLIDEAVGEHVEAMTPVVEVFGMISYQVAGGETIQQPVTLVGIEPESKDVVSPMRDFLLSRTPMDPEENVLTYDIGRFPADSQLDWSLTPEAEEMRRFWVDARRFREEAYHEDAFETAMADTSTETAFDPFAGAAESPELAPAAEIAPGIETEATDTISNPFFDATAAVPTDPYAPSEARLYIASGLISRIFPSAAENEPSQTQLFVVPGQDITVTTIKAGVPEPVRFSATVCDIFKSGLAEYDQSYVFCNLDALQAARGMLVRRPDGSTRWQDGAVTHVQLKLKDYANADLVVSRLRDMLRETPAEVTPAGEFPTRSLYHAMHVETWEQRQAPILNAIAIETAVLNILLALIICVAGFGILAIFYMIVTEKTRDIGILKALGASSRGVMSIFLSYGLALGLVGSGIGVGLGLLFVANINGVESLLTKLNGRPVFDESIYYFSEIPTHVAPMMVVSVAVGAISIAVLASVLPALRAARLHPVQALRWE